MFNEQCTFSTKTFPRFHTPKIQRRTSLCKFFLNYHFTPRNPSRTVPVVREQAFGAAIGTRLHNTQTPHNVRLACGQVLTRCPRHEVLARSFPQLFDIVCLMSSRVRELYRYCHVLRRSKRRLLQSDNVCVIVAVTKILCGSVANTVRIHYFCRNVANTSRFHAT